MKKTTLGMCTALLVSLLVLPEAFAQEARRYALIVANNSSVDADVEPLRYADDDGARFYEMFESYADSSYLLTTLDKDSQEVFPRLSNLSEAPTRQNLKAQVAELQEKIAADKKAGVRAEVYLVFTGHGNVDETGEGYLSLADGPLKRSDLYRDVIRPLDADYTHVIIDACHAYFMVNARGGDWKDDRSGQTLDDEFETYLRNQAKKASGGMATIGVILSTAGAAEVHEWSRYRAGVFSHQLRSGLLGAADANGDGNVTYPEIEAYLAAANAAVTNPRAKIRMHVSGPKQNLNKPLTRINGFHNATIFGFDGGKRMHIEDTRGLRYVDLHSGAGNRGRLVLLKKPVNNLPYYLRTGDQQATIATDTKVAAMGQLAFEDRPNQTRGSVEESFRADLFSTPFGPAFVAGYQAGRDQGQSLGAATVLDEQESTWNYELAFDYAVSTPPIDLNGLQHQFGVGFLFRHETGWGVGPFAEYGISPLEEATIHRLAGGVEGNFARQIGMSNLKLGVRGRAGIQTILFDADEVSSDPISLRASAAVVLSWRLAEQLQAEAIGGVAMDVVTRAGVEENDEDIIASPFGGIGIRF